MNGLMDQVDMSWSIYVTSSFRSFIGFIHLSTHPSISLSIHISSFNGWNMHLWINLIRWWIDEWINGQMNSLFHLFIIQVHSSTLFCKLNLVNQLSITLYSGSMRQIYSGLINKLQLYISTVMTIYWTIQPRY